MVALRILADKGAAVFTITPDTTRVDAARMLNDHKVGAAVVVDPVGAPVGVVSERDLTRVVAEAGASGLQRTVGEAMSRALVTAGSGDSIDRLLGLMTERRAPHLITMENAAMAGLVSIGDVVKRKITEAEAEAESLKDGIEGA